MQSRQAAGYNLTLAHIYSTNHGKLQGTTWHWHTSIAPITASCRVQPDTGTHLQSNHGKLQCTTWHWHTSTVQSRQAAVYNLTLAHIYSTNHGKLQGTTWHWHTSTVPITASCRVQPDTGTHLQSNHGKLQCTTWHWHTSTVQSRQAAVYNLTLAHIYSTNHGKLQCTTWHWHTSIAPITASCRVQPDTGTHLQSNHGKLQGTTWHWHTSTVQSRQAAVYNLTLAHIYSPITASCSVQPDTGTHLQHQSRQAAVYNLTLAHIYSPITASCSVQPDTGTHLQCNHGKLQCTTWHWHTSTVQSRQAAVYNLTLAHIYSPITASCSVQPDTGTHLQSNHGKLQCTTWHWHTSIAPITASCRVQPDTGTHLQSNHGKLQCTTWHWHTSTVQSRQAAVYNLTLAHIYSPITASCSVQPDTGTHLQSNHGKLQCTTWHWHTSIAPITASCRVQPDTGTHLQSNHGKLQCTTWHWHTSTVQSRQAAGYNLTLAHIYSPITASCSVQPDTGTHLQCNHGKLQCTTWHWHTSTVQSRQAAVYNLTLAHIYSPITASCSVQPDTGTHLQHQSRQAAVYNLTLAHIYSPITASCSVQPDTGTHLQSNHGKLQGTTWHWHTSTAPITASCSVQPDTGTHLQSNHGKLQGTTWHWHTSTVQSRQAAGYNLTLAHIYSPITASCSVQPDTGTHLQHQSRQAAVYNLTLAHIYSTNHGKLQCTTWHWHTSTVQSRQAAVYNLTLAHIYSPITASCRVQPDTGTHLQSNHGKLQCTTWHWHTSTAPITASCSVQPDTGTHLQHQSRQAAGYNLTLAHIYSTNHGKLQGTTWHWHTSTVQSRQAAVYNLTLAHIYSPITASCRVQPDTGTHLQSNHGKLQCTTWHWHTSTAPITASCSVQPDTGTHLQHQSRQAAGYNLTLAHIYSTNHGKLQGTTWHWHTSTVQSRQAAGYNLTLAHIYSAITASCRVQPDTGTHLQSNHGKLQCTTWHWHTSIAPITASCSVQPDTGTHLQCNHGKLQGTTWHWHTSTVQSRQAAGYNLTLAHIYSPITASCSVQPDTGTHL